MLINIACIFLWCNIHPIPPWHHSPWWSCTSGWVLLCRSFPRSQKALVPWSCGSFPPLKVLRWRLSLHTAFPPHHPLCYYTNIQHQSDPWTYRTCGDWLYLSVWRWCLTWGPGWWSLLQTDSSWRRPLWLSSSLYFLWWTFHWHLCTHTVRLRVIAVGWEADFRQVNYSYKLFKWITQV